MTSTLLAALLQDWRLLLTEWSLNGILSRAAQDALRLPGEPEGLRQLIERWGAGDWRDLPPVAVLPASAMPSAAGAYAMATGTIYLNQAWLQAASREAALAVLTEELGHHLDGLLNASDTPGDEGELFAALLLERPLTASAREAIAADNDQILIQAGSTTLLAEAATITGTELTDTLTGGFGDDSITGLGGNDQIDGQAGADIIRGGDGNDTIEGNFGNDSLYGDAGNDTITDNQGANIFDGGLGNDTLTTRSLSGNNTLIGGAGNDTINATGLILSLDGGEGDDNLNLEARLSVGGSSSYVQGGNAILSGGPGRDRFYGYDYSTAELRGGADNDYIYVSGVKDSRLYGDAGDDTIVTNISSSSTSNTDGNDRLAKVALVDGGDGNDSLTIEGYLYLFHGRVSASASGGLGDDTISITNSNSAAASGYATVTVDGGAGNDSITVAGSFSTSITTGSGRDTIVFTAPQYRKLLVGAQLLSNPDGSTTAITPELFSITDFSTGSGGDVIDYGDLLRNASTTYDGSNPFATGYLALRQSGADTLLSFDPDGTAGTTGSTVVAILRNTISTAFIADNFNPNFPVNGGVELPNITLALLPASATEDGTANLIYTFSRSGPTTSALAVNYGISGTADSSDYTGATPGAGKTITFAAGSATATLTIDPTVDTTIEPDDTVALTLAAGTGYTVGTTAAVTATINDDDFPVITTAAVTATINDDDFPVITLAVAPAAVAEDGSSNLVYTFIRTGPATSALTVNYGISGTADSSDYTGATPGASNMITFAAGSATALLTIDPTADTTIEVDETVALSLAAGSGYSIANTVAVVGTILNDDTALENQGNTALLRGGDGQPFAKAGSTTKPITFLGSPASAGNASSTWQMLAAETIGTANKVLWRYNTTGQLHVWALDFNWAWTGADTGLVDPNSSTGWGLEASFQLDLNSDSIIGAPFTAIESQGNTNLVRHNSTGQPYASAGSSATAISFMGSPASPGNASSTWQMLAAETIGAANKILWRYNPTGQVHVWALDSNWAWTGADTGLVDPNSSAGWELEASFQLDLNADSIIGTPFTAIESQGNTNLFHHISTAQPYASVGSSATPITFMGSPASPGNASSSWQMLAAETIGTANKVLWRYNPSGQVHVWALDANWAWTGADTGLVDTNSSAGWELESSFQLDLNADAIIGTPFTAIESQGNTSLVRHNGTGQPYASAGSTITPITFMGSPASPGNASSTWQMLAAETIGTANKILWRYNSTGQMHVWALDSNWAWTGADTGLVDPNSSAGWELESSFQLDLNGDAIIGTPFTAIESQGNTSLVRHNGTGQPYVSVGSTITPITFMGSHASPGNASSTWQMLAAETMEIGNKILWRYNPTGQVHMWALDSNWAWTGADTGLVDPNSSSGAYLLARFGVASI